MKKRKISLVLMSTILSVGILFGCNGVDEDEPDPTEEPSEEMREQETEDTSTPENDNEEETNE
ncbi:MAG TPA: hypothetical protein VLA13_10335 [Massilibacterium sp.]|nr:hypothetical protein [Massilibacterium sp.]